MQTDVENECGRGSFRVIWAWIKVRSSGLHTVDSLPMESS